MTAQQLSIIDIKYILLIISVYLHIVEDIGIGLLRTNIVSMRYTM